jgi:Family of unknown function (DUF6492)
VTVGRTLQGLPVASVDKPLDVVIKTRVFDAVPFAQLQKDLAAHSRLHGRIYVVVPRNERDQLAGLIGKNYIVMTAEEVASIAGYTGGFPDTWCTQQIIKIIAANVVEHDYFLILDSNTLIGFAFDERQFLSHGRYVYAVNDFYDVAWELQSRNFLGLHAPCRLFGFRAANQIFSKQNVQALIRHVEGLYSDNIVRILLTHSDDQSSSFWTEFALYGAFVTSFQQGAGHFFEERSDLVHFSARNKFVHLLRDIEARPPLMIKFNKARPGQYDLGSRKYARRVSEIKQAYRRSLSASETR